MPSVWPGLPNHLTTPPPNPQPTTLATSEARQLNDQAVVERREHDRLAEVLLLSELKDKIAGIHDLPLNSIIDEKNQILFAANKYFDKPEVKFCLVVNVSLNYELWSADRKIKKDCVRT